MPRRITNYNFSEKKVTAIVGDPEGSYYLIIAFAKDGDYCTLRRVSANDLTQVYSETDVAVDEIKRLMLSGNYFYSVVDNDTLFGTRYYKFSLIATTYNFTKPAGITENAVDVVTDGSFIYYLTPGSASGEVAKLIKYSTYGTYVETIELQKSGEEVRNAKSITIDSSGDFWIITNTSPSNLVRVFDDGGWDFTVTELVP